MAAASNYVNITPRLITIFPPKCIFPSATVGPTAADSLWHHHQHLKNFPFRPCCFCVRKRTRQQTLTFQRLQHLDFTILLKKGTNTNRESHAETMAKQQKAFCTGKKKERKLLEIYTFTCSFIKMFNFINLC